MTAHHRATAAIALTIAATAPAAEYFDVRPLGGDAPTVRVDADLYRTRPSQADDAERKAIAAITAMRKSVATATHRRPPVLQLDCRDPHCRTLEAKWGSDGVLGLYLGDGSEPASAALLRELGLRPSTEQLAARLAATALDPGRIALFDLRRSPAGDVLLAVMHPGEQGDARNVLHWLPQERRWRHLGDIHPLHTTGGAWSRLDRAVIDRLTRGPKPFRLIAPASVEQEAGPRVAALAFDGDLVDGLQRLESFTHGPIDGAVPRAGTDLLVEPNDAATLVARLRRFGDVVSASPLPGRAIWLADGGTMDLAVAGSMASFQAGGVGVEWIQAVDPATGRAARPAMVHGPPCELPRAVVRRLFALYEHLGAPPEIHCAIGIRGGVLLTAPSADAALPETSLPGLVGGEGFRARLQGAPISPDAAIVLAQATHTALGTPFPLLSVMPGRAGVHYAAHADGDRVWRSTAAAAHEVGQISGIDIADERHRILLDALNEEKLAFPVKGAFRKPAEDYVALEIDGLDHIIASSGDGAVVRVELGERATLEQQAIHTSLSSLVRKGIPRSFLVGDADVAVALQREGEQLVGGFVHQGMTTRWFDRWPTNLERANERTVADGLLRLAATGTAPTHVWRRADILATCRPIGNGSRAVVELGLLDLTSGSLALLPWDGAKCTTALGTRHQVGAAHRILTVVPTPRAHVLGFLAGDVLGVLRSTATEEVVLHAITTTGAVSTCAGTLATRHPARDPLTRWLGANHCIWMRASPTLAIAHGIDTIHLFDQSKRWSVEPLAHGDRLAETDAERLLSWVEDASPTRRTDCHTLRFGNVDEASVLAAPCVGLVFWREPRTGTQFQRADQGGRPLAQSELQWLVRHFDAEHEATNRSYALSVSRAVSVTEDTRAPRSRLLIWETRQNGQIGCAIVLNAAQATPRYLDSFADLLDGPAKAPESPSQWLVRETRPTTALAVASVAEFDDCVVGFHSPPEAVQLEQGTDFNHFVRRVATPDTATDLQPIDWYPAQLGDQPWKLLRQALSGAEDALASIYHQAGQDAAGSRVALRANDRVLFAILRGERVYHRILESAACRVIASSVAAEIVKHAADDEQLDNDAVWELIQNAVSRERPAGRWFSSHGLKRDFRLELTTRSTECI